MSCHVSVANIYLLVLVPHNAWHGISTMACNTMASAHTGEISQVSTYPSALQLKYTVLPKLISTSRGSSIILGLPGQTTINKLGMRGPGTITLFKDYCVLWSVYRALDRASCRLLCASSLSPVQSVIDMPSKVVQQAQTTPKAKQENLLYNKK